jgi:hypothetical protein
MTRRRCRDTVESCAETRTNIQKLVLSVLSLHPNQNAIDHIGLTPIGNYHLHLSPQGSWIRVGSRQWELARVDLARFVADRKRRNSRFMTRVFAAMNPRQPTRSAGRFFVVSQDGSHRARALFRDRDGRVGTRRELGLGYMCRRLTNENRRLLRRALLVAELCPAASPEAAMARAKAGWIPEHNYKRPPGMWRSRFQAICVELRGGRKARAQRVFHGRSIWEKKLPPPQVDA